MTGYHSRSLLDLAPPDLRPHLEHDDRRSGADSPQHLREPEHGMRTLAMRTGTLEQSVGPRHSRCAVCAVLARSGTTAAKTLETRIRHRAGVGRATLGAAVRGGTLRQFSSWPRANSADPPYPNLAVDGRRMPIPLDDSAPALPPLDDDTLRLIQSWIAAGAAID